MSNHYCFGEGSHEDGCSCDCSTCTSKNKELEREVFNERVRHRAEAIYSDPIYRLALAKAILEKKK